MDLTIVIVSFKSEDILHRCIKSIDKKYPIIVVENSIDKNAAKAIITQNVIAIRNLLNTIFEDAAH